MNASSRPKQVLSLTLAMLVTATALFLASCKQGGAESKPADVDYYTCTMHPSVRSQDPHGKCPICGMNLVPVKKKSDASKSPAESEMQNMPGMTGSNSNAENSKPTEFTVPVERQQQIGVTYASIESRPFQRTIRALGTVTYDKQRRWDYVARVGGYVQKLGVSSQGVIVEKGAPLLSIYSPELLTAQREFVDVLKMRDDAQTKNSPDVQKSAEQLVASGRERLRLWNITDEQISELEKTRNPQETLALISPFKGIVQELTVEQGRRVAVGDPLVSVTDLSVVWVWAQFYQDELSLLKNGLPVTISTSANPDEKFHGKISIIDPFINDALRTERVRIDVDNPDFKLRPGMYVDVEITVNAGEGLAVPVSAVLPTGLHNIAFVDKGQGKLEPRYIEVGRKFDGYYEIKSGLAANERVVSSANFLIDAEAKVQGALKTW